MTNPTISVVVPVYNVEKYLRDCIDSIRRQTYQDFEIIMVEDCSTDGSRAIAEEIAAEDKRTRLFCHTRNMGQSAARNLGMDVARGEYVSFVDSDDFIESYCLSDMMYFDRDYLPKELVNAILDLYMKKTKLKGIEANIAEYMISKNMLNAGYGMMVTDIVRDELHYDPRLINKKAII